MNKIKTVIAAGGLGTRLQGFRGNESTKILLEVRGKKYPAKICKLPFYKKSYVKGAN